MSEDLEKYFSRSFTQRAFGPMAAGSVRGSIFTLLSVGLGTGMLAYPGLMAKNGFVTVLFILLTGYLAALWSFTLILES